MQKFNIESRQSIYFELSYVIASQWTGETMQRLDFQRGLAERGLDFPQTGGGQREFVLIRRAQSPLQVKIAAAGPRVSSVSISSEKPEHTLDMFIKEAESVCAAFTQVALAGQGCQVLQTGGRIRHLYSCSDHAFKFLWEDRLGQSPEDFKVLGKKPVSGGGLRLVMPPLRDEEEPVQIEVKIESFFAEPKKMFVDTFLFWPRPRILGADEAFDVEHRLQRVETYATGQVCDFILRRQVGQ